MNLHNKVSIPAQVMARQVGEETVILDLASGTYFGLDLVGARVWELLSEGRAPNAVCETMLVEYDVSRDEIERDLSELLDALVDKGLIRSESA
jgi:hypothetical protein